MNFKKMNDFEIAERIERIGGQGWVTPADYKRFSRQAMLILEALAWHVNYATTGNINSTPQPKSREWLERVSGSRRVASRIDELRDEWEIETAKTGSGEAAYKLIGRRWEPRQKKAHCSTCHCFYQAESVPEGQIGMNL